MFDNFRELYRYRALIGALVVRHLAIRYRGSLLGYMWSLLNPLCLMLVYMLVFRYYIRFDHVDNYTIFLFCGLLPWLWFQSGLQEGSASIVSSGHLITKSMFPAQILPTVSVLTNMVNFLLSLPLLVIFMIGFGVELHLTFLLLPVVMVAQFLFLIGLSLGLSALNVHYRDVQHVLANILTFVFFLCPILYPIDIVPEGLRFTLEYNPIALLTVVYQDLILHGALPSLFVVIYLVAVVLASLLIGNGIFNYYRESFAELL